MYIYRCINFCFPTGEYVCEIETYGSPLSQTSTLEILGKSELLYLSEKQKLFGNILYFIYLIFICTYA